MEPFFESQPPFVIKVYDKHFEITWDGALKTPEDEYPYKNVSALKIIYGKKERSLLEHIWGFILHDGLSKKMEAYDELLIELKNGNTETRYVHGPLTESMHEAIDMINDKLKYREFNR